DVFCNLPILRLVDADRYGLDKLPTGIEYLQARDVSLRRFRDKSLTVTTVGFRSPIPIDIQCPFFAESPLGNLLRRPRLPSKERVHKHLSTASIIISLRRLESRCCLKLLSNRMFIASLCPS